MTNQENFEQKSTENNEVTTLLKKIEELEKENQELRRKNRALDKENQSSSAMLRITESEVKSFIEKLEPSLMDTLRLLKEFRETPCMED